jgi:hypothetical protein
MTALIGDVMIPCAGDCVTLEPPGASPAQTFLRGTAAADDEVVATRSIDNFLGGFFLHK